MQSLTLPATLEALPRFAAFAHEAASQCGLDDHAAWEVQLAVDEAVTNIIEHAYGSSGQGTISMSCTCQENSFVVVLRDSGRPFEPESVVAPNITAPIEEREAGGLGMFLMRRLMDKVEFQFDPSGVNELTMVKLRGPALPADLQVVALSGRIDAAMAPKMAELVREALSRGARRLVLDFTSVVFLSSSGLRTLLLLGREIKALGGEMRLCSLQPQVFQVFSLTGFDRLFPIYGSREEAVASFGAS